MSQSNDPTYLDPRRSYRLQSGTRDDEVRFQIVVEETDLEIVAEQDFSHDAMLFVQELRGIIKSWIAIQPEFLTSLVPIHVPDSAPPVIQRMAEAAEQANTGPMAAVAGTVSQQVAEHFHHLSPNLLVENGGDLYLFSTRERTIGLLPMPEENIQIGMNIPADEFPVSLCTSSGKIGHSLSFGQSDIVVIRAANASFADTAATALANELKGADDLERVLEKAASWAQFGLEGIFAQCQDKIAAWGKMELAAVEI